MSKKADTIIHATIKLFLQDGVKKNTMDDIAKNANSIKNDDL
jgi:AcrR family transcriptional regulator